MSVAVRGPEDANASDFPTAERRYAVLMVGTLWTTRGSVVVRINNLSAGGLMGSTPARLPVGTAVLIKVRECPCLCGRVAWLDGDSLGIAFDRPLDIDALLTCAGHPEKAAAAA